MNTKEYIDKRITEQTKELKAYMDTKTARVASTMESLVMAVEQFSDRVNEVLGNTEELAGFSSYLRDMMQEMPALGDMPALGSLGVSGADVDDALLKSVFFRDLTTGERIEAEDALEGDEKQELLSLLKDFRNGEEGKERDRKLEELMGKVAERVLNEDSEEDGSEE